MTKLELIQQYGGPWESHPIYSRGSWQYEVVNNDTNYGYWEWVAAQMDIELTEDKAAIVRKACAKAYNLDLDQYIELFGTDRGWKSMGKDFSKWFCQLDSENSRKFCEGL